MLEQATKPGDADGRPPEGGSDGHEADHGTDHEAGHGGRSLAEQRRRAAARNWLSIVIGSFVVVLGVIVGAAWAFGGNRVPPSSAGAPGAGFHHVIASSTATNMGGAYLTGAADGLHVELSVPGIGVPSTEHVAVSVGDPASFHLSSFSLVPSQYRGDHALAVFGVVFSQGGHEVLQQQPVTLSLTGSQLRSGDAVVLYSPKSRTLGQAGGQAQVVNGQALVRLTSSTDVAVVAR